MYEDWINGCLAQGYGHVHAHCDPKTQLRAVIAVHDTTAGPSLGGCRLRTYDSSQSVMEDVLRLARGMTLKSLHADLPLGGGKAVIWMPEGDDWDRTALFESFGRFVDSLGGQYITAVDMGTSVADMDVIAQQTRYVTCTSSCSVGPSDPSSLTALGTFYGLKAAVKAQFNADTVEGLTVAIQGVGHVGMKLATLLHEEGAKLAVCDVSEEAVQFCKNTLGAQVRTLENIYETDCDVLSPCAIGGILNHKTIPTIKARVIAGAANNQLAHPEDGQRLQDKGILFAPDYVVNAGGIIHVAYQYHQATEEEILNKVKQVYDTTLSIIQRAQAHNTPPSEIAETMALEKLAALQQEKDGTL